jgi:ketosteroid isomerase-like protein
MTMTPAQALVERFLDALATHDFDALRGLLAEEGFRFESPITRLTGADAFTRFATMSGAILQRVERRRCFVDGDDVCHWLVFVTQLSERLATPTVQWARVADGRIQSIEMCFDPHRYRLLFQVDDPTDDGRTAIA